MQRPNHASAGRPQTCSCEVVKGVPQPRRECPPICRAGSSQRAGMAGHRRGSLSWRASYPMSDSLSRSELRRSPCAVAASRGRQESRRTGAFVEDMSSSPSGLCWHWPAIAVTGKCNLIVPRKRATKFGSADNFVAILCDISGVHCGSRLRSIFHWGGLGMDVSASASLTEFGPLQSG